MSDIVVKAVKGAKLPTSSIAAPAAPAPAVRPEPKFVHPEVREKVVPIKYGIEHDGTVYQSITLRRPTMREWEKYNRAVAKAIEEGGEEAADLIDAPFYDAPAAVINLLDFVDGATVSEELEVFFAEPQAEETGNISTSETGS